jgi:hypothetical protein
MFDAVLRLSVPANRFVEKRRFVGILSRYSPHLLTGTVFCSSLSEASMSECCATFSLIVHNLHLCKYRLRIRINVIVKTLTIGWFFKDSADTRC